MAANKTVEKRKGEKNPQIMNQINLFIISNREKLFERLDEIKQIHKES